MSSFNYFNRCQFNILIQKAAATSELTVVTLEKDTVSNKVGYVPDFAVATSTPKTIRGRSGTLSLCYLLSHQVVSQGTKGIHPWFVTRLMSAKSDLGTTQKKLLGYLRYVFISNFLYSLFRELPLVWALQTSSQ